MIKENLITISLTRLGIEKSIDIPADMLFELMETGKVRASYLLLLIVFFHV